MTKMIDYEHFQEWQSDPIFVWYPVVEPEIPGVERFLTDQPVDLIRSGNYNQVPVFMGVTQDEFGFRNISECFLSFSD